MNAVSGLVDVIDDPPLRYGFIVLWSDSAMFILCKISKLSFCTFMLL